MSRLLRYNDRVEVHTHNRVFNGLFKNKDDDYIEIAGEIGDDVGKRILIPVETVTVIKKAGRNRDDA